MKLVKPSYFDSIQQKTEDRWKQLEGDLDLAAPWHQLFNQVQSPRHVISELLQNADDAQATEVSVKIIDGIFRFSHNGQDFSEDEFASLCRFGYSNKRVLRTIGFRGIGFKSTFSLGDTVGLSTPTLKVAFHKKRFTLPVWIDGEAPKDTDTKVFVKITDDQRQKELLNNMQEWFNSPFSLLFFTNIRRLKLGDHDLQWINLCPGPVPDSTWMGLHGKETPYLVVRSPEEPFPDESLKEIREERLLDLSDKTSLPPCKVEIVLGAPGQLFVVLPTGVQTLLPFAMNAPFVQDPARLKIKDPAISHTNRWLLQRIGQLAANASLQWLQRDDLDTAERAKAYDLLPVPDPNDGSLEGVCTQVVTDSVVSDIKAKPYVLTDDGHLETTGRCISLHPVVRDIWSSDQLISILSAKIQQPLLLSKHISRENDQKLLKYHAALHVEADEFLEILTTQKPPQPKTWYSLLKLWEIVNQWNDYYRKNKVLNVHPVRGRSFLHSANEVVRLGEKKLLQSEDDWDFLSSHLLVMDVNWLRYLTEQRRMASDASDESLGEIVEIADRFLQRTNLGESSNLDVIIEQVAKDFFDQSKPNLKDCVRFTQIAAKLNAKIGSAFQFWTRDGKPHSTEDILFFDDTKRIEEFIPPGMRNALILHDDYSQSFQSCSRAEWLNWISSGNSGIKTFVPVHKHSKIMWGKKSVTQEVATRSYSGELDYPYVTSRYEIEDWDFSSEYWKYWKACAGDEPNLWGRLVEHLLNFPKSWENVKSASIYQIATTGNRKKITDNNLLPTWILKLRELPCLRDTRGNYRNPTELMRRTPQTESLLDVEFFVDAHLDTETARPFLDLLGVRSIPTGPKQILRRLSVLAKAAKPPLLELTKWYQRLDTLFDNCITDDQQEIRSLFHNEALIFTEDGTWKTASTVFISSDENEAPNAALIHSEARHLSVWRKIGVNERPNAQLTVEWLKSLPSGEKIPPTEIRRVRALLGRHPIYVWQECGHWLNLAGQWTPMEELSYSLTMQSLIRWTNLHEWVKEQTADLQMLGTELISGPPFAAWPSLASQLEKRIERKQKNGHRISLEWLQALGRLLLRIRFDDQAWTTLVRDLAGRLAKTEGQRVETITVIPYLNGKPAGLPENEQLEWVDRTLYITEMPKPRLIRQIPEAIAHVFDWPELKTILAYSFDRNEKDIQAYLNENYVLDPEEVPPAIPDLGAQVTSTLGVLPTYFEIKTDKPATMVITESTEMVGEGKEETRGVSPQMNAVKPNPDELHPSHPPKHAEIKTPLIERFAVSRGYDKKGFHHFIHSNGNMLRKADGVFPWLVEDPGGQVICYYWIKEHCLQNKPLELPTEIWHLIEEKPQQHALILEDLNGNPIGMHGIDLQKLKENGTLKLFPATYRLTLALED